MQNLLNSIINFYRRYVKTYLETKIKDKYFWIEIKMKIKKVLLNKDRLIDWKNEQELISLVKQLKLNDLYDEEFIKRNDPYARIKKKNNNLSPKRYIESIIFNGTDPSTRFSQELYKEINEDAKYLGQSSILHYLAKGIKEKRKYAKSKNSFQDTFHVCRCESINLTENSKFLVIDMGKYQEISVDKNQIESILICSEFENHHKIIKINDRKFKLSNSKDITYFLTCGAEAHTGNNNELIANEIEELVYITSEVISTKKSLSLLLAAIRDRVKYHQNFINFWPESTFSQEYVIGYKLFRKNFILPNVYSKSTLNSLFFADIPNSSALVSNQRVFNETLINRLVSYEIDWARIGIEAKESQIRFASTTEINTFSTSKILSYNEAKYFKTRENINKKFSFELEKYPRVGDYSPGYLKMNGNVSQVNLGASRKTIDLFNSLNMIPKLNLINVLVWRLEDYQDCDVVLLSEEDISNSDLNIKDKHKVVFLDTKNYAINANSFDLEFMVNPRFNQFYDGTHFYRYNLKLTCESNNLKKLYFTLNIVFASRNLKVLDSFVDPSFSS
jgi:hypothetical protein